MQPLGQTMSTDNRAASSSASWYVCGSWSRTMKTGVGAGTGSASPPGGSLGDVPPLGSETAAVASGIVGGSLEDGSSTGSEGGEVGSESPSKVPADDAGASSEPSDDHVWETTIPITKATATAAMETRTRPDLRLRRPWPIHFQHQRMTEVVPRPRPLAALLAFCQHQRRGVLTPRPRLFSAFAVVLPHQRQAAAALRSGLMSVSVRQSKLRTSVLPWCRKLQTQHVHAEQPVFQEGNG